MQLRRLVSLTALLTFLLLVLTGVVLYIVPQGRVAYWSGWTLWGLSKTQWTSFHINLALLFLIAGALHVYYNWKAITTYLRDRLKRMVVLTREFVLALLICLLLNLR